MGFVSNIKAVMCMPPHNRLCVYDVHLWLSVKWSANEVAIAYAAYMSA